MDYPPSNNRGRHLKKLLHKILKKVNDLFYQTTYSISKDSNESVMNLLLSKHVSGMINLVG